MYIRISVGWSSTHHHGWIINCLYVIIYGTVYRRRYMVTIKHIQIIGIYGKFILFVWSNICIVLSILYLRKNDILLIVE